MEGKKEEKIDEAKLARPIDWESRFNSQSELGGYFTIFYGWKSVSLARMHSRIIIFFLFFTSGYYLMVLQYTSTYRYDIGEYFEWFIGQGRISFDAQNCWVKISKNKQDKLKKKRKNKIERIYRRMKTSYKSWRFCWKFCRLVNLTPFIPFIICFQKTFHHDY